ncbi:SusC/RagA family TonB-linked outer membrane protein [Bacteroides faecium]|uniref:SusC/RagA family TonB-linked outer membrane protein n=1 Tax=Bacteroides faecium TaxID=2715212 RepID=A0A6H0KUX6_9BACE|nr:SusC/RagA family TonB-linked outer membrane protein [Bacteroides faecium]QIU96989.1 SusC/RagA family TonB-linked outer membrane protein [Bacteroides faecium]
MKQRFSQHMRYYERSLILILMLFSASVMQAQNRTVKGTVSDAQGEPIIGANVVIVGGTKGVITDLDGKYSIQVPENGAVLKFSYIGFKTKSFNVVKGKNLLNVTLEEDAVMLEQTVVTAMDLRRDEKSLSTAFQKMDVESMTENRDAGFVNMLAGKVAGLQVISNGAAGSATVRIRGANSISGNNQPLYVIDGVPIINDVTGGEIDYGNPANSINPDDIENIVVLKGANASALYGSDAANGAILITTKKAGQRSGLGVTYSTNVQFTEFSQYPIYQNIYGGGHINRFENNKANSFNGDVKVPYDPNLPYGIQRMGGYDNSRSWGMPMLGFQVVGRNGELKSYVPTPANTTSMYQTAYSWTNSVSIERATEHVSTRIGFTNLRSDDVLEGLNNLTRNAFNVRSNVKLTKSLDVDLNGRYTHENVKNRSYRNNSDRNPIYTLMDMPRDLSIQEMYPWKDENGKPTALQFKSPVWMLNELSNQDKKEWILADITINYKLTKDLKLRLKAALDMNMKDGYEFRNMYTPGDADGFYKEFTEKARNYTYEAMLSYNKTWKDFNVSASVGTNMQDFLFKKQNSEIGTLATSDFISLTNNGATIKSWPEYNAKKKQAVYGTASVGYKDFIYMDVTGRNDWSSALPSDNRSYFYSSYGVSFVLTELVKSIPKDWLSYAKVRGSYAKVGNDTGFDQLLNGFSYNTSYLGDMAWFESENKRKTNSLKPESTTSFETGLDLRFLKDRASFSFTYYNKNTKNQILTSTINGVSGYGEALFNAGEVKNWGYEVTLGVVPFKNKDWEWKVDINWAKNNSEVVSLANGMDYMTLTTVQNSVELRIVKGEPLVSLYCREPWKTNDEGQVLVGANGRPLSGEAKFLASVEPKWTGSIRTSLRWKDLTFSAMLDVRMGGHVWSETAFQSSRNAQSIMSMGGRTEHLFSDLILNEGDQTGYLGILDPKYVPNGKNNIYMDASRPKGMNIPGAVYDSSVPGLAGQPCQAWIKPIDYWTNDSGKNGELYLYDASYVKLKEISLGYNIPKNWLRKIGFIQSMRVSAVGRNVAILHQKTPKGIDPEATSSMGIQQGLERGFNLPTSSYGFDFKITF